MLNGRIKNDYNGKLTHIDSNGCSLVDYVLSDSKSCNNIVKFDVHRKLPETDDCPLTLSLKMGNSELLSENTTYKSPMYKYVGISENVFNFDSNLEQSNSQLEGFY